MSNPRSSWAAVSRLAAVAALVLIGAQAHAQTYKDKGGTTVPGVVIVDPTSGTGALFTSANPGQVAGSFSASLGGFTPSASGARMTPLSVTTSDSSGALPTGAVTVVSNVGATNPMYCNVNGVAATTSDQLIGSNSWFAFTIPGGVTTLHCIATGGSTTANGLGGAGLPTGAIGGSGGGGGGGAITAALGSYSAGALVDGASVTDGAKADTAYAGSGSASIVAIVKGLYNLLASPLAVTGTFFQTTQPVSAASLPLPAGAATAANQPTVNGDGGALAHVTNFPSTSPSHVSATSLVASLVIKTSAGALYGYNCSAITGGSAGYCVAYNAASTPSAGALTGANVLDVCYFGVGSAGCSLNRAPTSIAYSTGIVILVTSASSPFTFTNTTDTAFISSDFQ